VCISALSGSVCECVCSCFVCVSVWLCYISCVCLSVSLFCNYVCLLNVSTVCLCVCLCTCLCFVCPSAFCMPLCTYACLSLCLFCVSVFCMSLYVCPTVYLSALSCHDIGYTCFSVFSSLSALCKSAARSLKCLSVHVRCLGLFVCLCSSVRLSHFVSRCVCLLCLCIYESVCLLLDLCLGPNFTPALSFLPYRNSRREGTLVSFSLPHHNLPVSAWFHNQIFVWSFPFFFSYFHFLFLSCPSSLFLSPFFWRWSRRSPDGRSTVGTVFVQTSHTQCVPCYKVVRLFQC
jgi:hypothetical protein